MSANVIADHDRTQAVARAPDVVAQALSQTPKRPEVISFSNRPEVRGFFDERTCSVQYVVSDPAAHRCAIIDPVLDFDERSGSTATRSADAILDYVRRRDLAVDWILDTHPHADHFSAAGYLKDVTGAPTAIGEHVVDVQRLCKALYNLSNSFPTDGSQWDHLFADGEAFQLGGRQGSIMFSPGHTLASSPMSSVTRPSSMTRCSCRMAAPPGPTFLGAMHITSGRASSASSRFRTRRASSPDTTTRPAAGPQRGKAPLLNRRRKMPT
jgi:hypothetical protein